MMAESESSGPRVRANSEKSFKRLCKGMCSNAAVKLSKRSETPFKKFRCLERRDAAN